MKATLESGGNGGGIDKRRGTKMGEKKAKRPIQLGKKWQLT